MNRSDGQEPSGFFDRLFGMLGEAIADIRHKVVEEGWFGRQVTDAPPPPSEALGWDMPRQSFDELWKPAEQDKAQDAPSRERDGPDLDL